MKLGSSRQTHNLCVVGFKTAYLLVRDTLVDPESVVNFEITHCVLIYSAFDFGNTKRLSDA